MTNRQNRKLINGTNGTLPSWSPAIATGFSAMATLAEVMRAFEGAEIDFDPFALALIVWLVFACVWVNLPTAFREKVGR